MISALRRRCRGHGCGVRYVGDRCPACDTARQRPPGGGRHRRRSYRDVVGASLTASPLLALAAFGVLAGSVDTTRHIQPSPPAASPVERLDVGEPVVYGLDGHLYFYRGPGPGGRVLISTTATGPTRQVAGCKVQPVIPR